MFRVVTSFTPQPVFWMIRDDISCGVAISKPLDLSKSLVSIGSDNGPRLRQQAQKDFLDEAMKQGWLVSLGAMMCPGHHQQLQAQEKAQREQRILAPQFNGGK